MYTYPPAQSARLWAIPSVLRGRGQPGAGVVAVNQDVWPDIAAYSPSTLLVYRHQPKDNQGGAWRSPTDIYKGKFGSPVRAYGWRASWVTGG